MSFIKEIYENITSHTDIFDFSKQELNDPAIEKIFHGNINDTKQYYYIALYYLFQLLNTTTVINNSDNHKLALKNLTLDLRLSNNKIRTIYTLANYYFYVKNYDEAIKYFGIGIKFGDVKFMNRLGDLYHELTNYKTAIEYYKMAIKKKDYSRLNHIGYCYDRLGQLDKAIKYYNYAIETDDIFALDNIGIIYHYCSQNIVVALKYYKLAIESGNLFAIEHYLKINNNLDNIVKCIKTGISKGIVYSFTTKDFIRKERNNTYLCDNQKLLFRVSNMIDDNKFKYKPLIQHKVSSCKLDKIPICDSNNQITSCINSRLN